MPLKKPKRGADKKVRRRAVSQNIRELIATGRSREQAVAIAMQTDRDSQKKKKKKRRKK